MTIETTLPRRGARVRKLALATLFTTALLVPAGQAMGEASSQSMANRPALPAGEKPLLRCHGHHCGGFFHHRRCCHHHHHGHHDCKCPPGARGPQGPRGERGERGPAGPSASVDSVFREITKYVGFASGGRTFIIVDDPRRTPRQHDLSSVEGHPANVVGVSVAVQGPDIHVTVRSDTGQILQARCTVAPEPGTGPNPAWPENCEHEVNGEIEGFRLLSPSA
ncbi:hypothetical protein GCM10010404_01420 [Nonomuraea africana]|uniref:C2H2-type domain-containing protein n=1 Tax=Nonomuraea africana TaxID=46171 RepID=A0ABR9KBU5_9ACTN|nr:collagen-like protein [Nonomuraea africana]MBE1559479.1 hypothetical protein [Nonomuraea africana]